MSERLVERFDAKADDGRVFVVSRYQSSHAAPTFDNPRQTVAGFSKFETAEGYACDRIDDDTFKIVPLDLIVERVR